MPKKRNCVCDWGKTLKTTGPVNLGNNCDSLQMLQITFSCKCGFGGETMIERFQSQAHQNVKKGTQCTQKTKLWWEPHTKITSSFTCGTITKSRNTWDSICQTLGCFSPRELLFCSNILVSCKTVLFALVWETNRLQRNSVSLGEKLQRKFAFVEWHCATLHVVGKCRRTDFNFARFFGVRDSGTPCLEAANFVRVQSCTHFAQVCAQ